jgi:uncharacterized protein with von Willebrand factor type A (vWA) domain
MRARLTRFVQELRAAGLRISVAETLDAMQAAKVVGIEPVPLREALAASLVKDEADRGRFDAAFDAYFAAPPLPGGKGRGRRRGELGGGA